MYLGVASPVLEVFRRGGLPREVRLLAARGLATQVDLDRLALLALMSVDPDPEVAALATTTIDGIALPALQTYLTRPEVPAPLREFFEARRVPVAPAPPLAPVRVPQAAAGVPSPTPAGGPVLPDVDEDEEPSPEVVAAVDQVAATVDDEAQVQRVLTSLPVPDKIKLATLGRREQRAILIRDPNLVVAAAVMASPKLTETEVEMFARMQSVSQEVLRSIGTSRVWLRSYAIVAALVKNPRTPPSVSLPLLTRLQERDVKGLIVNRNLPESVRLAAGRFMAVQQGRRGG